MLSLVLSFVIGIGYVFYAMAWLVDKPANRFYNKLLKRKVYLLHIFIFFCLFLFGVYRIRYVNAREALYMAPFFFLIFLRFFNSIVKKIAGRNIYIITKSDVRPVKYKWYLDGILSVLLLALPFIICGYISNKIRFGSFFI